MDAQAVLLLAPPYQLKDSARLKLKLLPYSNNSAEDRGTGALERKGFFGNEHLHGPRQPHHVTTAGNIINLKVDSPIDAHA